MANFATATVVGQTVPRLAERGAVASGEKVVCVLSRLTCELGEATKRLNNRQLDNPRPRNGEVLTVALFLRQ